MAPLPALLLLASFAAGEDQAAQRLQGAADLSAAAAAAPGNETARDGAAVALEGGAPSADVVDGRGSVRRAAPLARPALTDASRAGADVPPPAGTKEHKLSTGLVLGGAAVLGGLQGWFSYGALGAAAGAGLGLAAAWLFSKKDYGGAFGVTAGAIIGTAFGGPLGGLIGAAVGGLLGHFLGGLFLH